MMLNTIIATKKHRLYPSTLDYIMQHHAMIPYNFRDTLSEYYLLYWSTDYFLEQMKDGVIKRYNNTYHICFHKDISRGKLMQMQMQMQMKGESKNKQVSLSFRKALPEFSLPAYVFVSLYK